MTTRYISVADTAKEVRKALKAEFPGVKFTVRSDSYSGGASIRVGWVDGPTTKAVRAVTGRYEGATFDGMIDLKSYHTTLVVNADGTPEEVHYGADYIFTDRTLSAEFGVTLAGLFYETFGRDADLTDYSYRGDRDALYRIAEHTPGPVRSVTKIADVLR